MVVNTVRNEATNILTSIGGMDNQEENTFIPTCH